MDTKLRPTERREIKKKDLWDIKAARLLDIEKIRTWLKEEASGKISGRAGLGTEKTKAMRDAALASYAALSLHLEQLYEPDTMRGLDQTLKDAQRGLFEEKAPTPSGIAGWWVSLFMAGSLEIGFFSYLVLYKGAGGLLIGMSVLLLVGGLLAAHGSANLMTHSQKGEYESTEVRVEKKYVVLLVIGIILITSVTALRYAYGGPLAGIIAVLFGMAVTTTEAFLSYYKTMRKYYLDKMFQAQTFYAAIALQKDLKELGNYKDDSWFVQFAAYIDDAMGILRTVGESDDKSLEKKANVAPQGQVRP